MALVVLNPVIKSMVDSENYRKLIEIIREWDFRVTDSLPGIKAVKNKYREFLQSSPPYPVIDSRCPRIEHLILNEYAHLTRSLAPIHPILIEGSILRQKEYGEKRVIIVAPCEIFKVYSSRPFKVMTWLEFQEFIQFYPPQQRAKSAPIPLGFFDFLAKELGIRIEKASGRKSCRDLLANFSPDTHLLELLWCKGGCHRGDGLW
jgi:iron only hydrogenase large subunit-like protein